METHLIKLIPKCNALITIIFMYFFNIYFNFENIWKNFAQADGGPLPVCACLTGLLSPHRPKRTFLRACVYKVTVKHLPQPIRSHIQSFRTQIIILYGNPYTFVSKPLPNFRSLGQPLLGEGREIEKNATPKGSATTSLGPICHNVSLQKYTLVVLVLFRPY